VCIRIVGGVSRRNPADEWLVGIQSAHFIATEAALAVPAAVIGYGASL
jgi:hypothetical protein